MGNLIAKEVIVKTKLLSMSRLINNRINELEKEKHTVHESLVRVIELERQKWLAKAETMVEVLSVLDNELFNDQF